MVRREGSNISPRHQRHRERSSNEPNGRGRGNSKGKIFQKVWLVGYLKHSLGIKWQKMIASVWEIYCKFRGKATEKKGKQDTNTKPGKGGGGIPGPEGDPIEPARGRVRAEKNVQAKSARIRTFSGSRNDIGRGRPQDFRSKGKKNSLKQGDPANKEKKKNLRPESEKTIH